MKIALFQAEWWVSLHLVQFAHMLRDLGHQVDVYLFAMKEGSARTCDFEGVRVVDYTGSWHPRIHHEATLMQSLRIRADQTQRLDGKRNQLIWKSILRLTNISSEVIDRISFALGLPDGPSLLPRTLIRSSEREIKQIRPDLIIGWDALGMIWGGILGRRLGIPYIYYSLELYTEYSPLCDGNRRFRRLRRSECQFHRNAAATLIQDPERAAYLYHANRVTKQQTIIMPVSVPGPPCTVKSSFAHRLHGISLKTGIVLSFGIFSGQRCSQEMVQAAQSLPSSLCLLVHAGIVRAKAYREEFERANTKGRAYLSVKRLEHHECEDLIRSSTIGLALYRSDDINIRLIGRASEKAALYTRAGIPFIAFSDTSLKKIIEQYDAGVCINSITELSDACHEILANYSRYVAGALNAFREVYCLDTHRERVHQELSRVASQCGKI